MLRSILLLAAARAELKAKQRTSQSTASVSLDGCPDQVQWRDAPFPSALEPGQPNYARGPRGGSSTRAEAWRSRY